MSELSSETNKDTAAVKWITYLTLIYLPGTFVAVRRSFGRSAQAHQLTFDIKTLFGMNFFAFNQQDRQFVIAKEFWIYVAAWLPLTLFTVLAYLMLKGFHESGDSRILHNLENLRLKHQPKKRKGSRHTNQDLEKSAGMSG